MVIFLDWLLRISMGLIFMVVLPFIGFPPLYELCEGLWNDKKKEYASLLFIFLLLFLNIASVYAGFACLTTKTDQRKRAEGILHICPTCHQTTN